MEVLPITNVPIEHVSRFEHTELPPGIRSHEFVHRDSMVSVRLSDPHTLEENRPPSEVQKFEQCRKEQQATVRFEEVPTFEKLDTADCDTGFRDLSTKSIPAGATSPSASLYETSAIGESELEPGSGILHVRTGSIDSSSSGESAHVDWEILDKNEKQEQQDECSDDVRAQIHMGFDTPLQTNGCP